jgi:hypothetical protein
MDLSGTVATKARTDRTGEFDGPSARAHRLPWGHQPAENHVWDEALVERG